MAPFARACCLKQILLESKDQRGMQLKTSMASREAGRRRDDGQASAEMTGRQTSRHSPVSTEPIATSKGICLDVADLKRICPGCRRRPTLSRPTLRCTRPPKSNVAQEPPDWCSGERDSRQSATAVTHQFEFVTGVAFGLCGALGL